MMITVKDFGSNIEIFGSDYNFYVSGDDCRGAFYEENLDDVLEKISDAEGRDLTAEEKEMIEDKIHIWLDVHSSDKFYAVVKSELTGNSHNYIFKDLCDAMDKARDLWLALSREAKKYITICVCEMPEYANPDDLDDGDVIWENGEEV